MEQQPQRNENPLAGQAGTRADTERADIPQTVADLMSTAVYAVAQDETVLMAWEILERTGFHHLPVVHPDGHCVGLLGRDELAAACSEPATSLSSRRVRGLLRGRRSAVVQAEDPVRKAATMMISTGADALPVVGDHGILVGLLTARDIVAACAGQPVPTWRGGERPPVPFPTLPGLPPPPAERRVGIP
jgi:CBS domain-containing protein